MSDKSSFISLNATDIPAVLKAANRWSPWQAVWNVHRAKFDKIPKSANNVAWGLSTSDPHRWFSYERALKAHQTSGGMTAGIGYVMTTPHGIVGVDLDNCTGADGTIAPWAQEVLRRLGGYAERSPSGRGLRIFVLGEIEADWTNSDQGIECYAGHAPRFLTVTGSRLASSPVDIPKVKAGGLEWLAATYMRAPSVTVGAKEMPDLLPVERVPMLEVLDLSLAAEEMLRHGDFGSKDRSSVIFATSVELFREGLSEQEVFSFLVHNEHVWEAALDKRQQNEAKALTFLWVHQTVKAHARWLSSAARLEDFDDLTTFFDTQNDTEAVDEFEDLQTIEVLEKTPKKTPPAMDYSGVPLDILELLGDVPPDVLALAAEAEAGGGEGVGDMADMSDLLGEATPVAVPEKPAAKEMRFAPMAAADYAKIKGKNDWFIYGVLPKADICTIFGESGAGKTFFTLDLVARIAEGRSWYGKRVKKGKVLYVVAEGAGDMTDRLKAYSDFHGVDLNDLDLHIIADQPNLLEVKDVKDLVRAAQSLGRIDLIVIDTLAQTTPGASENSSEDMGTALAHCRTLRKYTGATICFVGHSGKDGSKGVRGWSGIKGAMDSMIELTRSDCYRTATIHKLRGGKGEGDEYLFKLAEVDMEDAEFEAEYGERLTSLAVAPITREEANLLDAQRQSEGDPAKAGPVGTHHGAGRPPLKQQQLWDVISDIADSDGIFKLVTLENTWKDYCEENNLHLIDAKTGHKKDRRKERMTQALEGLIQGGWVVELPDGRFQTRSDCGDAPWEDSLNVQKFAQNTNAGCDDMLDLLD